ncbi:ABC transporter substrate-binding protein [Flavobacteriaceae bacterium M23B6Z8]
MPDKPEMRLTDQTGRHLELSEPPHRIISLVPSQTELLVDLGLSDYIVGVTKFCVHPEHLRKEKTVVGGTKQVRYDRIKKLKPDLILCNKEENTLEMVNKLQPIAPVHVSDVKTISDNLDLIKQYGELFDCIEKSRQLVDNIEHERSIFKDSVNKTYIKNVLYFIWRDPWMSIGSDTFIHAMLKENYLENYNKDQLRYPEIDLTEAARNNHPDLIFLSSEPYPFKEKHRKELHTMFPDSKIIRVDGEFFSWYGSRLLKAYNYFKELQKQLR